MPLDQTSVSPSPACIFSIFDQLRDRARRKVIFPWHNFLIYSNLKSPWVSGCIRPLFNQPLFKKQLYFCSPLHSAAMNSTVWESTPICLFNPEQLEIHCVPTSPCDGKPKARFTLNLQTRAWNCDSKAWALFCWPAASKHHGTSAETPTTYIHHFIRWNWVRGYS